MKPRRKLRYYIMSEGFSHQTDWRNSKYYCSSNYIVALNWRQAMRKAWMVYRITGNAVEIAQRFNTGKHKGKERIWWLKV